MQLRCRNETQSSDDQSVYSKIIQEVITRLKTEVTEKNNYATDVVIRSYFRRNAAAHETGFRRSETKTEKELRAQIFLWEEENTAALLESGKTDKSAAEHFLNVLKERTKTTENRGKQGFFRQVMWVLKHMVTFHHKIKTMPKRGDFEAIIISNMQYVLDKLNQIKNEENAAEVEKLAAEFELMSVISRGRNHTRLSAGSSAEDSAVYAVVARGFAIERELIQEMFERNRISRETAKGLRADILTLEAQLQSDFL